jgi:hypothetical protein
VSSSEAGRAGNTLEDIKARPHLFPSGAEGENQLKRFPSEKSENILRGPFRENIFLVVMEIVPYIFTMFSTHICLIFVGKARNCTLEWSFVKEINQK